MKSRNLLLILITPLLFFVSDLHSQRDLIISGVNDVSVLCGNSSIYVWGNNSMGGETGLLGTGGEEEFYDTPQLVTFPGGEEVLQANSGSGSHFVVLDCDPMEAGEIAEDQIICYDDIPEPFTSVTDPSGGDGSWDYQWQSSADGSSWVDITGATSLTYEETSNLTETTYYRRNATNDCGTVESNEITATVSYTIPPLAHCEYYATIYVDAEETTKYTWYLTETSTDDVGTTTGSGSITIDVSDAEDGNGTDKIMYMEEVTFASGMVMEKHDACDPDWEDRWVWLDGDVLDEHQSGFTVYEPPITLEELSVRVSTEIYELGVLEVELTFGVYGSEESGGSLIADENNQIGTFTHNISREREDWSDPEQIINDYVIDGIDIILEGEETYFISLDYCDITGAGGGAEIGRGNCTQDVPVVDNVTGDIIHYTHSSDDFSRPNTGKDLLQGKVFDVSFSEGALPIELISFEAIENGQLVNLKWKTATEVNNDYFKTERSKDGNNFETVATIEGSGTTSMPKEYEVTDTEPYQGLSYYKLTQVDFDGQSESFPLEYVYISDAKDQLSLEIYYTYDKNYDIWISGIKDLNISLHIFDTMGSKIFSQEYYTADKDHIVLNQNDIGVLLKQDTYIVVLSSRNDVLSEKLIIF